MSNCFICKHLGKKVNYKYECLDSDIGFGYVWEQAINDNSMECDRFIESPEKVKKALEIFMGV